MIVEDADTLNSDSFTAIALLPELHATPPSVPAARTTPIAVSPSVFRALMRICQAPLEVVSSGDVHLDGQHSEERPNGNDVRSRLLEAACAVSSASVITTSIDLAQRSNPRT